MAEVSRDEYRNSEWRLNETRPGYVAPGEANLSVLMDIRDELQKLNRLLGCENFTSIPTLLRLIRANTAKPKKRKRVT